MSGENVDFVVGLIAIESLAGEMCNGGAHVDCDATLGGFLIHLASGGVPACEALETSGSGCLPAAGNRFAGQARLSARLGSLAAELELAVAQVRRKIAAARQPAA
jgi:hypothetical protein